MQVKLNLKEEAIPPSLRSRGVFIIGFPPTRPFPPNSLELYEGENKINHAHHASRAFYMYP